eukprot:gene3265-6462_t
MQSPSFRVLSRSEKNYQCKNALHSSLVESPSLADYYYHSSRLDFWSFAQRPLNVGLSSGLQESLQQALSELPAGHLPNICIVEYSSKYSDKLTETTSLRIFDHLLSYFPSLQAIVGTIVDEPSQQNGVSVTFGSLPGKDIVPFHMNPSFAYSRELISQKFPSKLEPTDHSFLLFPHASTSTESLNSLIDSLDTIYPGCVKIGSLLSTDAGADTPTGFLVERGFPQSQVTFIKSGVVGLSISSDISQLKDVWPSWKQSLIPMLRWANTFG